MSAPAPTPAEQVAAFVLENRHRFRRRGMYYPADVLLEIGVRWPSISQAELEEALRLALEQEGER